MSESVVVKTQAEFDAAFAKLKDDYWSVITIDSPEGVWLTVRASGSATVRASGSATVEASGSATVEAYESATVRASGSATVEASGSATVEAYESATVRAYGSATVEASGSATVRAYESATVEAKPYVAVHLFSDRVTVSGGVVIDVASLDRTDWAAWSRYHGVSVTMHTADDGADELIVYKAVDDNLKSGRGFSYPIGETVEDPAWEAGDFCGGGLHFSPHPHQAKHYFTEATRFLECAVSVAEVSVIDGNYNGTPKLKAKRARVLREVTIDAQPVTSA